MAKRKSARKRGKMKEENKRTLIYIAVLVVALLLWVLLTSYTTISEPGGRFREVSEISLWKHETSFDNVDMDYVNSVLPDICDVEGLKHCTSVCTGVPYSYCAIENVYTSSFRDPETGKNVLRLHVTIKGNTDCQCSL